MINKQFKARATRVEWEGEYVGTVHPLGPDAFVEIAAMAAPAIADIFALVEETEMSVKGMQGDPGRIADFIVQQGPALLRRAGASVPELLDEIILFGMRCADDVEARRVVAEEYSLPLRLHIVSAVIRTTFTDDKALRDLLGNAQALLRVGDALSSATVPSKPSRTAAGQAPSAGG